MRPVRPTPLACAAQTFILSLLIAAPLGAQAVVPLAYETHDPPEGHGVLESTAIWIAPDPNQSLLLITDKTWSYVELHNAAINTYVGRVGGQGSGPGELFQPNGIAIAYGVATHIGRRDVMLVTETGNDRVSMFALPEATFLGSFGSGQLGDPFGIAALWLGPQLWVFITSTVPFPDRVDAYKVNFVGEALEASLQFSFPVPFNAQLESIAVDPWRGHLLLSDEGVNSDVMVYDLNGNFIRRFGNGHFVDDPEGIALYELGQGLGYIVVSDQTASPTEFEVFERGSYVSLGNFVGPTENTDGIAITTQALFALPFGSFYAVHDDDAGHAYHWQSIAEPLGLCVGSPCDPTAVHDPSPATPPTTTLRLAPNPSRSTTTITYALPAAGHVSVRVYSTGGRLVDTLVDAWRPPGTHTLAWRGGVRRTLASGLYWVTLTTPSGSDTRTITIIR